MAKKSKSIREHIVLPIVIILLIQAAVFLVTLLYGDVAKSLRSNSVEILNEYTKNGKLYMEKEIVHRWIKEVESTGGLEQAMMGLLKEKGYDAEDIKTNPLVNREILLEISPQIIDLLHRSYATGAFVILDGPAAENSKPGIRSGVYIRDLDPNNYAEDNSDLLLERGLPSLANDYGIALDSFWELGFDFENRTEDMNYFFKPYEGAKKYGVKASDANNFGYMSAPFSLHPLDTQVISYSKPIVLEGIGTVGVIGLDMTLTQVQAFMKFDRPEYSQGNINLLGIRDKDSSQIKKAVTAGPMFERSWGTEDVLELEYDEELQVYSIESNDDEMWYASVAPLDIYNHNTPFENEEWVFMNMSKESEVLKFSEKMREMILLALIVPLVLGTFSVIVAGRMLAQPIRSLVADMRRQKNLEHLKLKRVNIDEIDELTEAIESLSKDVAEGASKISNILNNVNIPIGVFEYKEKQKLVFCSKSLFEILDWEEIDENYFYMEEDEFQKRMNLAALVKDEKEPDIYYQNGPSIKWYRLSSVQKDGDYLGVLSDITAEMAGRKKLEKERDFDLLTNLYNRRGFRERVAEYTDSRTAAAAMVMWDLDNLKYINDTYGHDEGDRYIVLFADQLRHLELGGGIISRYAGDEFLTFLYDETGINGKEMIRGRLKQFMNSLKDCTMEMKGGYQIPLRVSAGIAWYPDDTMDYNFLVSYADFAMYTVKHNMKGIMLEFDRDRYREDFYLLAGNEELNQVLEGKSVKFAFQPIVARTGELFGYELLMRPKTENLKSIAAVLNLAKSQAKLNQVESLTWFEGLRTARHMLGQEGLKPPPHIFINSISSVCLSDAELETIEKEYGDFLGNVVVELTEGEPVSAACLRHKQTVSARWQAKIAIDDYGSGYNSETVLLEIKPDFVKLDMGLVRNIHKDETRKQLVKSMIDFASHQGIRVLAEGVENFEELSLLMAMQVDYFQGFYIGRPEEDVRPLDPYIVQKIKSLE